MIYGCGGADGTNPPVADGVHPVHSPELVAVSSAPDLRELVFGLGIGQDFIR